MGYMGDTDDDDVKAKVLVCKQKGLSDFLIEGQCRTVRAFAVDPLTGRQFYFMLTGSSGPDDFTFAEVIDGHAQDVDGKYVDVDVPASWAPKTGINDFLEVVGGGLDDAFWDAALASFLDLYRTVDDAISTAIHYFEYEQGRHMTTICEKAAVDSQAEGEPDTLFQAFAEACQRRAPFAEEIIVWFPDHTELFDQITFTGPRLPRVEFGYQLGQAGQIGFVATGVNDLVNPNLYLNGCWTEKHRVDQDLMEAYADPWDRHGAKNAAQDLLAIQSTAMEFLRAEHSKAVKRLDEQRALLSFEVFGGYEPKEELEAFDQSRDDKLREELSGPIGRVEKYLATCCAGSRKTALP